MTGHCAICGAEFTYRPGRGRPQAYCSATCRKAHYRRRRRAAFLATTGSAGPGTKAVSDSLGDLAAELFELPPDPMDAVLACVVHARTAAAMFGAAGERVSPVLALRCAEMADRIAADLKELFIP